MSGWVILPCRRSWKLGTRLKVLRAMFSIEEERCSRKTLREQLGRRGNKKELEKEESGRNLTTVGRGKRTRHFQRCRRVELSCLFQVYAHPSTTLICFFDYLNHFCLLS